VNICVHYNGLEDGLYSRVNSGGRYDWFQDGLYGMVNSGGRYDGFQDGLCGRGNRCTHRHRSKLNKQW
jgi:hypothetical protein